MADLTTMTVPAVTATSCIEAVQVYRRGATVIRTATVDLNAGAAPDEVEIVDLPLTLIDPTVRVRVIGGGDVVAAGVRVGLWVRPGQPPQKAPEQQELDDVHKRLRRARELAQHLDGELSLLGGVAVPDRPEGEDGKAPPPSPMAARLHLEQFVDEATRQRLSERKKVRDEIRALEEEELRIRERIAAASSAAEVHVDEVRKSVVARLRYCAGGAVPKKLQLELSYVVPGARWAPAYQCKLARDGSKAEIQLRAWVAQRSGEDWRGVKLRLSTAAPLMFTELPELSSVKIGRAQPPPQPKGFRAPPRGADVLFRDFDRDAAAARALLPAPRPFSPPPLSAPQPSLQVALDAPSPRDRGEAREKKRARRPMAEETAKSAVSMEMLAEADDMDSEAELAFDEDRSSVSATPVSVMSVASGRPAAAPPPMAAAPSRSMAKPAAKMAPPPPDDVLQAIVYPLLRLPPPSDAGGRGRLVPVDGRAIYGESVARFGRPLRFDPLSAVRQAEEHAQAVLAQSLPDGCVDADDISSHFDFAYEADGVVEVVGDGGFHSVALGDRTSDARMRYIAVPREELAVYRVAMLTNPIPAPLLPGPAEVYVGGEYVLTTRLPTVPARGELKLGLGVEQSIKIARNTKFSEVRSGEKVVAMSELVHDIDIDVVNHLEREIEIEVRERVPIPATGAEVVVEEVKVTPPWSIYDQEERSQPIEGGRRWEIKVPRGGAQKLCARYVVKIYANNEVVGGNRREQ